MAGYVGNQPVPQSTQTRDSITATAGQVIFPTKGFTPGFVDVYLNGAHLVEGDDYISGTGYQIELTLQASLNDVVEVVGYKTFEVNSQQVLIDGIENDITDLENSQSLLESRQGSGLYRNAAVGQLPLSQGQSQRVGFSATTYTGNGSTQSIDTGVDMDTGDFGGLVWVKKRNGGSNRSHNLFDTVRGATQQLRSDLTVAETTEADGLTSFNDDGFSVGGSDNENGNTNTYISWSWQTTEKFTGTTNRNKAYTAHYNPQLGFSIVGYEGDGAAGHEIPHHLGRVPELTIFKSRDVNVNLVVFSEILKNKSHILKLNLADEQQDAGVAYSTLFSDNTISLGSGSAINSSSNNFISYNFTSIPKVSKVGKYIGTGAAGNYIDCGFKPAWVMVKNLSSNGHWVIQDVARGDFSLYANTSNSDDNDSTVKIDFVENGFAIIGDYEAINTLNDEYLFLAYADTNSTTGRTDYDYPTTADTLSIENGTLISHANGYNANGEVNLQELVPSSTTMTFGTGYEDSTYYVYKNQSGSYGTTENRPLENQDYSGVQSPLSSDKNMRTTAKHFDYESSTGVASASGEFTDNNNKTYYAYQSFNKVTDLGVNHWLIPSTTTSFLQYKYKEKRVLKSWRLREANSVGYVPKRFTIEGSQNGFTWVSVDSTYTSTDYVGNSTFLWGNLSTVSNTIAYLYYRINITANNGDNNYTGLAELEFNTILPSDIYDVTAGTLTDYATQAAVTRTYLGSVKTDTNGDITQIINNPVAKVKGVDAEYHGDVTVHGELLNSSAVTGRLTFQGSDSPPLVDDTNGRLFVADIGVGTYLITSSAINFKKAQVIVQTSNRESQVIVNSESSITVYSRNSGGTLGDSLNTNVITVGGLR